MPQYLNDRTIPRINTVENFLYLFLSFVFLSFIFFFLALLKKT